MDSFVCNLHLHVEFNFPLGWTCVKIALKCPSVKIQCLGGRLLFYLKFILRMKKKANNQLTCELPKWRLWYEVENQESWEKSVCTPNAPKFTQKQAQACCAHHTSETGLSGDAGSPKPLCSGSRRDIFATTFCQGSQTDFAVSVGWLQILSFSLDIWIYLAPSLISVLSHLVPYKF